MKLRKRSSLEKFGHLKKMIILFVFTFLRLWAFQKAALGQIANANNAFFLNTALLELPAG